MRSFVIAAALAGLVTTGCQQAAGPERELSGARLFQQYCARCHGPAGGGMPGFPGADRLANKEFMDGISDAHIKGTIRMGKPPLMPPFGERFTDAALEVLIAHVRGLSGSRGPDQRARMGAP